MPEDSPWLEMLVNEDQLLSQIVTLCSQNGWDIVDEFHKVVYSSRLGQTHDSALLSSTRQLLCRYSQACA